MLNTRLTLVVIAAVLSCAISCDTFAPPATTAPAAISALGTQFVANAGQFAPEVAFHARTAHAGFFVTRGGNLVVGLRQAPATTGAARMWAVSERADGAAAGAPRGIDREAVSYGFVGTQHHADVASYRAVDLGQPWPGIGLRLQVTATGVEKLFELAPGANAAAIRMAVSGVDSLDVDAVGRLVMRNDGYRLTWDAPIAYQDAPAGRQSVEVAYVAGEAAYGFRLGPHDATLPVVIDPIIHSTYLGGGTEGFYTGIADMVRSVARSPLTGDIYVAGITWSYFFPGTEGGFIEEPGYNGMEGFIARLDADLKNLKQATYFHGLSGPVLNDIKVNPVNGEVLVAGVAASPIPASDGGAVPHLSYLQEFWSNLPKGFISRFSPDLTRLLQSTYTEAGSIYRIALRPDGAVYAVGHAHDFGESIALVMAFSADLTQLIGRRTLTTGGSSRAYAVSIDDTAEAIYVAGIAHQSILTNPGALPLQGPGGPRTIFVTRLPLDLTAVQRSSFAEGDAGYNMNQRNVTLAKAPGSNIVYVASSTYATALAGGSTGAQAGNAGIEDAVISAFTADLATHLGSTFFGGSGQDNATQLLIRPDDGDVYLVGYSTSDDLPAIAGAAQAPPNYPNSGYVTRLAPDLRAIRQTTYLGGGLNGNDTWDAILTPEGEVMVVGASSEDLPGTEGGAQRRYRGADGFIMLLDSTLSDVIDTVPEPFAFVSLQGVSPNSSVRSGLLQLRGIDGPAPISVSGGSYSLDGAPYTEASGTVRRRQSIRLRQRSAAGAGEAVTTTLVVGGVAGTFTTVAASGSDTVPGDMAFATVTDVFREHSIVSAPAVVSDISAPAAISVVNGEYSIDDMPFTAEPGSVAAGRSIRLRHQAAATHAKTTTTRVTIGGRDFDFVSITEAADASPNPISMPPMTGVYPNTEQFARVWVYGINTATPISVEGGQYAIAKRSGEMTPPTALPGVVEYGDAAALIMTSGEFGETRVGRLTIGDSVATLSITSVEADRTPDPFAFVPVTNALPDSDVSSDDVIIRGFNTTTAISISGGEYRVNPGEYTSSAGITGPGDIIVNVRLRSAAEPGATRTATLTIGGISAEFRVTTPPLADTPGGGGGAMRLGWLGILVLVLAARSSARERWRNCLRALG